MPTETDRTETVTIRESAVRRMCAELTDALGDFEGLVTDAEVIATFITMLLSTLKAHQDNGGDLNPYRKALNSIYALLPPVTTENSVILH